MLPILLKGATSCADTTEQTHHMFSYLRRNSACRPIIRSATVRALTDHALKTMSRRFAGPVRQDGTSVDPA